MIRCIEMCWCQDRSRRPSFDEVLPLILESMVDVVISDPQGAEFWKHSFLERVNFPISRCLVVCFVVGRERKTGDKEQPGFESCRLRCNG